MLFALKCGALLSGIDTELHVEHEGLQCKAQTEAGGIHHAVSSLDTSVQSNITHKSLATTPALAKLPKFRVCRQYQTGVGYSCWCCAGIH